MSRPNAPRPALVLPIDRLPEPFRTQTALLEHVPWVQKGQGLAVRKDCNARMCGDAVDAGFSDAHDALHASHIAKDQQIDWLALCRPIPDVPWVYDPKADPPEPKTAPFLLALCWRYGWGLGNMALWRTLGAYTLRRTLIPWVESHACEAQLPLPYTWTPRGPLDLRRGIVSSSEAYRQLAMPAWPTFIRRELNAHDGNGVRVKATHYWPDASKIPG